MLTMVSGNMLTKWFDRYRGLVSGLVGACVALGFSAAPPTFKKLIEAFGWRTSWQIIAVVVGVLFGLIVLVAFRDNPAECGLHPDGIDRESAKRNHKTIITPVRSLTLGQACRTWEFWLFSLGLAMSGLYQTGLAFHVVSIFEEAGMTETQAVAIFLPSSVVAVVTHLSAGSLSNRIKLNYLLAVMMAGLAVSTVGAAFLRAGLPVVMIIVGNGIAGGMMGLLSAITWPNIFGLVHLGSIRGFNMSIMVLFSAVGPFLFSQSLTRTGSYRLSILLCLAAVAVLFAASFFICRKDLAAADESGSAEEAASGS